jgi:hypothetical protein
MNDAFIHERCIGVCTTSLQRFRTPGFTPAIHGLTFNNSSFGQGVR